MSTYNKEYYGVVARLLRTHYNGPVSKNHDIENNVVDRIAEDFAAMFYDDNPTFNRGVFIARVNLAGDQ